MANEGRRSFLQVVFFLSESYAPVSVIEMPKNPRLRQRPHLLEKHGIKVFPERQDDSPFEQWFDQIEKLAAKTYRRYRDEAELEKIECPWRDSIRSQADMIAARAHELSTDDSVREATWRYSLEPKIFSRFDAEVTW